MSTISQNIIKSILFLMVIGVCFMSCTPREVEKKVESSSYESYLRVVEGVDELLDPELIKKGKVLISYGDCEECHRMENRSKGPAFLDIARRYPANEVYIGLLGRKIISGGTGSWGNPIMEPHSHLKEDEAEAMATYILSLDTD